jgi:hypothetical protein
MERIIIAGAIAYFLNSPTFDMGLILTLVFFMLYNFVHKEIGNKTYKAMVLSSMVYWIPLMAVTEKWWYGIVAFIIYAMPEYITWRKTFERHKTIPSLAARCILYFENVCVTMVSFLFPAYFLITGVYFLAWKGIGIKKRI